MRRKKRGNKIFLGFCFIAVAIIMVIMAYSQFKPQAGAINESMTIAAIEVKPQPPQNVIIEIPDSKVSRKNILLAQLVTTIVLLSSIAFLVNRSSKRKKE